MDELNVEKKVRAFYDGEGWSSDNSGTTFDAYLWEDLRPCAAHYVSACRLKILDFLPKKGDLFLDAASGPIQYPEYLEYSKGFKKRVCVDISQKALDQAKAKLGEMCETVCTSILELPFPDNHFDAVVSLHTIYHIDKKDQERAVRQLLRVAKPGVPVVIIYSNPNRLLARLRRLAKFQSPRSKITNEAQNTNDPLYFYAYPLEWWKIVEDVADVTIYPWRSLTAQDSRRFIPGTKLGKFMLDSLEKIEKRLPTLIKNFGAYPMIVITKRA